MKSIKILSTVIVLVLFPKLVWADSLEGLSVIEDIIYVLGFIVVVGLFFQILHLFSENRKANYFFNSFCIVLILFGIMAGGGELGINMLPAAISSFLVLVKRLLRKS